jgi:hypothetical protein
MGVVLLALAIWLVVEGVIRLKQARSGLGRIQEAVPQ